MQPGGGWNPSWPLSLGRQPGLFGAAASAASSSSSISSSVVNGTGVGQQQQQGHVAYWQALERRQHELRMHGSTFPSSSGSIHTPQLPRRPSDFAGTSRQLQEDNPNKGHGIEEHMQISLPPTNLQFDMQTTHEMPRRSSLTRQHGQPNMVGTSGRDQGTLVNDLKMQGSLQAVVQPHIPVLNRTSESFSLADTRREQGTTSFNERDIAKLFQAMTRHLAPANVQLPRQFLHSQTSVHNVEANQLAMSKEQASLTWDKEHNVGLSDPVNTNLLAQILPNCQYNRMMDNQVEVDTTLQLSGLLSTKHSLTSATGRNEKTALGHSMNDYSGQFGVASGLQMVPSGSTFNQDTTIKDRNDLLMQQRSKERRDDNGVGYSSATSKNAKVLHLPYSSASMTQNQDEVGTTAHQLSGLLSTKHSLTSATGRNENTALGHSKNDYSGQFGVANSGLQMVPYGSAFNQDTTIIDRNDLLMQQRSKEIRDDKGVGYSSSTSKYAKVMHLPYSSASMTQKQLGYSDTRNNFDGNQMSHVQYFGSTQSINKPILCGSSLSSQDPLQIDRGQQAQHIGFTKQQLYVLKAQIMTFRHFKLGKAIPWEVLSVIVDPPNDFFPEESFAPRDIVNQEQFSMNELSEKRSIHAESSNWNYQSASSIKDQSLLKGGSIIGEEKVAMLSQTQGIQVPFKRPAVRTGPNTNSSNSFEPDKRVKIYHDTHINDNHSNNKGKATWVVAVGGRAFGTSEVKKPPMSTAAAASKDDPTTMYGGPFSYLASSGKEHDSLASETANYSSSCASENVVKDALFEERMNILNRKRAENSKEFGKLLLGNMGRKMARPDLKQLQTEEKKSETSYLQSCPKNVVDKQHQEIMSKCDRPHQKFVLQYEKQYQRQRIESSRQVQQSNKIFQEKQLKSIFHWRKNLLETRLTTRDARTIKNKGIIKYHDRMLREFSKKNKVRNRKLQLWMNNAADKNSMLPGQQTDIPDDASERSKCLSLFLHQTEEYLQKIGEKISAARKQQEAAKNAVAVASAQDVSEEGKGVAASAGQEGAVRNVLEDSASANKYYNLAHAVTERVVQQPLMLRAGTLRDYQLVGLQWMLSLYNNKLNGILADEMGLGKTVQVMALIAYLMESKGNYGPHLIIVPNAVLFNWKSELLHWLPSVSCIFYVGAKDQRSKLFMQEVSALKFNVLVTTYEYVMNDRSKLSKIYWKYIIIDEAQRMKDRESMLARDLDKYKCERRLLLTGTPLQNDLKELWSLLNLLLPEIFDSQKEFNDWFSKVFRKDDAWQNPEEEDGLETDKKVAIIHRLHQILEPFMLRRRVQEVEGSLPPKVPIVLRCRMSAIQSAIYNWIKSTGTIRVDPEDEMRHLQKNPMYQAKTYKDLKNRCMELRKVCNHPLLNYPSLSDDRSEDFIVRSCGKLWVLDRILVKLQRAGHRVLLFSTMTKLLDILEDYLEWRKLVYRRIDGMTSLQDRESAILDFNGRDSDCFIFLLSIRAAGRGLNLQSADTVIIYDPDPNPQNEEQAVARAHRIGQTKEVKVIYMEAVVDKSFSFHKEDIKNGGAVDSEAELSSKENYMGSIESLMRKNIQQHKIEMTEEVINAGRFDQRTTHEERRVTLETLLHDEERYQVTVHAVPSLQEINRMIARGDEEVQLFNQMDQDFDWAADTVNYDEVPKWLHATSKQVHETVTRLSKKPSTNILSSSIEFASCQISSSVGRRKNRSRNTSTYKNNPVYEELDHEDSEDSDNSSEKNEYEEKEVGEFEDEENVNDTIDVPPSNKDHTEEEKLVDDDGCNEHIRNVTGSEHSKENGISKTSRSGGLNFIASKLSDSIQRKCKNVTNKLQSRMDKEGDQILPHLSSWWRKHQNPSHVSTDDKSTSFLDLHVIEQRLDGIKYNRVSDFIADVQLMLDNFVHYFETSPEVNVARPESEKFEDMFFGMMETAFPNVDFREARKTEQSPILEGSATIQSSVLHSTNVSVDMVYADTMPKKTLTSQITSAHDGKETRSFDSTHGKEAGPDVSSGGGQKRPESSDQLARPTEILVYKKRRKDNKSELKQRMNSDGDQTLLQESSTVPAKRPRYDDGEN